MMKRKMCKIANIRPAGFSLLLAPSSHFSKRKKRVFSGIGGGSSVLPRRGSGGSDTKLLRWADPREHTQGAHPNGTLFKQRPSSWGRGW